MADKPYTVTEFFKMFPDDDSCLEHLMKIRYGFELDCPKCSKHGKFSRIRKMPAYQCAWCGHHIHPMVGTPFEKSHTPLQKWFYVMYLFTTSRHGVPAKEIQRQLGVTYKTAWRMGHEIRKYMTKLDGDDDTFTGHVEADETFVGGRKRVRKFGPKAQTRSEILKSKAIVFGVVERGGKVQTYVVPSRSRKDLEPHISKHVPVGTTISTDEFTTYKYLTGLLYDHGTVFHEEEQWVNGIHHTNTIENFWSRLKNSIRGTHIHVSKKHLWKYLGEFEYRFNMRNHPAVMFDRLLLSF